MLFFTGSSAKIGVSGLLLIGLTTARLTRFITRDWLGEWLISKPAKDWSNEIEAQRLEQATRAVAENPPEPGAKLPSMLQQYDENYPWTWQAKLTKGLDCPFCVGFWIGALAIAAWPLTKLPVVGPLVKLAYASLSLNYVVGHVSSRID